MKYISQALQNLLPTNISWRMNGVPTNEQEFISMFEIVVGVTEINDAIYSNKQSDFGVTWTQIQEKIASIKELEITEAYKAQRQAEYPSFADQFDTIFHDGLDAWKEQIQAVKDKYPKA